MRLHDFFEYWARVAPESEYIVTAVERWSYARAAGEVERIAASLAASGCGPGSRVAILTKNRPELPLWCFACSRIGAVPVPLNFRLAPREWAFLLADSRARVLIAEPELAAQLERVGADLPELAFAVSFAEAPAGWVDLPHWFGLGENTLAPDVPADRDVTALQLYTSGTTGLPKGALVSQSAAFASVQQWATLYPMLPGERQLCVLPAYHIAGLQNLFQAAAQGACVYLMRDYTAPELLRVLAQERVVRAPIVPTMLADLLALPAAAGEHSRALRWITYGGAPMDPGLLRRGLERFGCGFQQSYGMTEVPCLTFLTPADHARGLAERPDLLRTVGRAGPGVELRIVDREGRDVAPGEVGEIWGRGPQLMSGYWNQPEASGAALAGGWMHTGDAGSLDRDGYLTLADRIKDLIVSGGENIVPREVEAVLLQHPSVADVAVIGTLHARWGEAVTAVVVLRAGASLTLAELDDFCRDKIGGYKRPRRLETVSELPRNASGKLLKRELRERYSGVGPR